MIPGFASALQNKYAILQQQADTARTVGTAQAGLVGAQTGEVAANAAAQRKLQAAESGEAGARAGYETAETGTVPAESTARVGLYGSEAGKNLSETALNKDNLLNPSAGARTYGWLQANGAGAFGPGQPFGGPLAPAPPRDNYLSEGISQPTLDQGQGGAYSNSFAAGTSKVPGHGSSKVDTVPAMLAPREAVLNEHAADMIGREHIAAANAIGNHIAAGSGPQGGPPAGKPTQAKGMTPPKGKAGPVARQGFAEGTPSVPSNAAPDARREGATRSWLNDKPQPLSGGTHMVGHGKSAKTPAKIDPAALMGLLRSLNPGGGVPAGPGGTPMGAPPVAGRGMV